MCRQRGIWQKLSKLKQKSKPEMALAKSQKDEVAGVCFKLVEKQLAESLMKVTQILKNIWLVLANVFLTQCGSTHPPERK